VRSFLVTYFVATVFLAAVLVTGRRGLRHAHLALVAGTLALLVTAVAFAELLGRELVFGGAAAIAKTAHFAAVAVAFALLFGMIVTGIGTLRAAPERLGARRRRHGRVAVAFVVAFLAASALGFLMVRLATPA
jgi:hypothetical protein